MTPSLHILYWIICWGILGEREWGGLENKSSKNPM
ncbi:hypothetical protein SLEP1_g47947 [Rubroshorea leprosula]|uniref:Uncharacterized protein n=1 Tax=Rubroshorea leprosula TaxID=152421 RepID=A0AAV5LS45_9ROSI|nr:hypothetical protein SLEP1_g47947 [Rubroshorea leprosula]